MTPENPRTVSSNIVATVCYAFKIAWDANATFMNQKWIADKFIIMNCVTDNSNKSPDSFVYRIH